MKRNYYPSIFETCYEECLPNGLRIRVIPKPGFTRKYAFYAINYGAIDTEYFENGIKHSTPNGVAHYLEHKTFDTEKGNALQIFSQHGANPNAFTSYSMTAYYFDCTENFDTNLRLLLNLVSVPFYTQRSVEKERGIIEQEIRMYEDSPESIVFENLCASLYSYHPIKVPIAGSVESIQSISAKTLSECHQTFYTPSNMMLCVVGDVMPEQIFSTAYELVPSVKQNHIQRSYGMTEPCVPIQKRKEVQMEIAMPNFLAGFKCRPANYGTERMRREIIADLASEVLIGESSELYQQLYEDGFIDSSFSCGYESVPEAAMLVFGGDCREPEKVCEKVLQQAQYLLHYGIDEKLFSRLKKSAFGRRLRDLDSFESTCYRQCAYYFEGCDYFNFPTVYNSVNIEDIASFLAESVVPEQMAISLIFPKGE